MGRMHSNGKGISASAIPYSRNPPAWLKTTPDQVVDQICKLAKKGATPSQIGVVLRDSHGIAQVKVVTGKFGLLAMDLYGSMLSLDCRQQNSPHPKITRYDLLWLNVEALPWVYPRATLSNTASAWSLTDRVTFT